MSMHRSLAAAIWLLVAIGAFSPSVAWASVAHTSKLHPWVLVALFWGVALVSVALHRLVLYLAQASVAVKRYWLQHASQRSAMIKRARAFLAEASDAPKICGRHLAQALLTRLRSWLIQARDAVGHAGSQHKAGARRAPGALIGWSRSALRTLRA